MNVDTQDSVLLQAILEATGDAIIVSDAAGLIVRTNPAAARIFQYSHDELVGQSVKVLMPETIANAHDRHMTHYADTGEKRIIGTSRDVVGRRKDQTTLALHISIEETKVEGEPLFIGILHDLTEHKITQEALARSQRLEAIGQMTGGIAHDFNNLLTVIIGNIELLEMRGGDDHHLSLLKDALDAAELGADLTARLLVFARKSNLQPVKADLRDLCNEMLALLKRTLGSSCHITTEYAPDVDLVMVDPVRFQAALMNLALNARDAMNDHGEMLLSIANVTIDDKYMAQETDIVEGNYVRISVSDDGAGMSEEAQRRAFEPFFTTKADSGGSGFGLATVYGFLRQSGGHITLYSELGHGTSFGLYFPVLPEADGAHAQTQPTDVKDTDTMGRDKTVLVVEDNPAVRKLSVARIQDLGFATEVAGSGDAAYRMLKNGTHADILFSDLVMPGSLNGYDLAYRVKSEFPHIKVLLTSGYSSDVITTSMARHETYDVLHKPFRQSDLAHRLQALLDERPDG